jgi:hypothetical protein
MSEDFEQLVNDIAVLTYFKNCRGNYLSAAEQAIKREALDNLTTHGHKLVTAELVQREYVDLLNKLAAFEDMHPELVEVFVVGE